MSREGKAASQDDKEAKTTSAWRSPTVIAAICTALITGVFGIINIIVEPSPIPGPVGSPSTPPAPEVITFPTEPLSAVLIAARRALRKDPGAVAMPSRIEAISLLRARASESPPIDFYPQATSILVSYLDFAVEERRGKDDGFTKLDRRDLAGIVTWDESIHNALEALQVLRRASPQPLEVNIGGIDFSYMNLAMLDLTGFNASHARFRHAFLSGCVCRGTIFDHADFREAVVWTSNTSDFTGASFIQADILGSKWKNVDFTGSNIEKATGRPRVWEVIVPPEKDRLFR